MILLFTKINHKLDKGLPHSDALTCTDYFKKPMKFFWNIFKYHCFHAWKWIINASESNSFFNWKLDAIYLNRVFHNFSLHIFFIRVRAQASRPLEWYRTFIRNDPSGIEMSPLDYGIAIIQNKIGRASCRERV